MTRYTVRMTVMVSFRVDDDDVAAADRWANRLGLERSELLREALFAHLARLAAETEVAAYETQPSRAEEALLDEVDDWGPAEEWTDWQEWADRRDRAAG
jgi:antitoxin component of RelBE/YafQ-DinJ toxin-antitoxin module